MPPVVLDQVYAAICRILLLMKSKGFIYHVAINVPGTWDKPDSTNAYVHDAPVFLEIMVAVSPINRN